MTVAVPIVFLAAFAAQTPAGDSLRLLALRLPGGALVSEARARPLAVREAVADLLTRSVTGPAGARDGELAAAHRLAAANAIAWNDSFLVREVTRFESWPASRRAAKVSADSIRRAGVSAYGRGGPEAAIAIWRRAASRAALIPDTAGLAAVLGNLGAGFLALGVLDSAETYLERSRALATTVGDLRVVANAIGTLAGVHEDRGDLAGARERHAQANVLRRRIGDTRGVAATYNNLGLLAQEAGNLDGARQAFDSALALNRREGRDEVAATNLLNIAGLAALTGDFATAEAMYRDALAIWRGRREWAFAADALHGLGQLELRRGNYPEARATLLEALAILDRTGPPLAALSVRRELAEARAAEGDMQGALLDLRHAERSADSARAPASVRAGIALARADLAVELNAFGEAERLYVVAERLYRRGADPDGAAEARSGRATLLIAREDFGGARSLLVQAWRAQVAAGNRRGAALTRLSLGQLAREGGDTAVARQHLKRAAADLDRLGDPVAAAAATGELAALAADAGAPAMADSLFRAALARIEGRLAPSVAWPLHAGLARVLRSRGLTDAAAREWRAALAEIERPRRSLILPERRAAFLADKWDLYAELARLERDRGHPDAAFEASERLRSRELAELLALGRVGAPTDTAAPLVAREQDLRRRIGELTREVEEAGSGDGTRRGPDVSPTSGPAHEALLQAQGAYAALLLEIREADPRHVSLVTGATAGWREVARVLAPSEALVEYLVGEVGTLAFVITRDTLAVLDLGIGRRDLARQIEFVRGTLDPDRAATGDSLWRAPLRRLHRYLIAPIEDTGLLGGKTRLLLVPHAELNYLPFAALMSGAGNSRFLVERYEIATTPSASVWLALGDRPQVRAATGLLALAPVPDRLPATRPELAAVARHAGGEVRLLFGSDATEAAFRTQAPRRRILHLATYGVLNKHNPLFSFVELAPGDTQDGRLEVHEVFGMRLGADLVVLSACQTGLASGSLADVPAGDDWVGLTRAFLYAGAARVVATLWPVEDGATATLMERFYAELGAGSDAVRALAAAQRAMLTAPGTSHPFRWAGVVAVEGGPAGSAASEGRARLP